MRIKEYLSERMTKSGMLGMLDIKLAQVAAMCIMVIIVKLFPSILNIPTRWFVIAAVLLSLRPLYTFYVRGQRSSSNNNRTASGEEVTVRAYSTDSEKT